MLPKPFQEWMPVKQKIHGYGRVQSFQEREIWWCSLGCNVGREEDGKNNNFSRPILIVKKFNKELFWGVSLTSKVKIGKFYYQFSLKDSDTISTTILSQLRVLDARRLIRQLGKIGESDFKNIQEGLVRIIKTEAPFQWGLPRLPTGSPDSPFRQLYL